MSEKADFLVEIGTEELPPKALSRLEHAFAENLVSGINKAGLTIGPHRSFATPRRLAVLVSELAMRQPPQKIEKRGPSIKVAFDDDGQPTRAALAFAKGCGADIEALARVKTAKGEWLQFNAEAPGVAAAELLPDIVRAALRALPIPKRMRWGSSDIEFVRPVHWVIMLFGDQVIDCEILGRRAEAVTYGHRFHAPDAIVIDAPSDYENLLKDQGRVLPGFEERKTRIRELACAGAAELKGQPILDAAVLDEVTALVEWPVLVTGKFEPEYLRLPEEVLIATLQTHQRYFPIRDGNDKLVPDFITISNLESLDPDQVRKGNERVVAPRLADAAFFWDQDRRKTLDARRDSLSQVIFQKELGSLHDKAERVAALTTGLADILGENRDTALRAAALAKTDLLTQMVGEFPELQGRMGYYYAVNDGELEAVATAIDEQYQPKHSGGVLPTTQSGRILALADRLDTIVGIFASGKRPTGNKDPFGLRRAAIGIARILIESGIDLDLIEQIRRAISAQPVAVDDPDQLVSDIYEFMIERMRSYYLEGLAPGLEQGAVTPEIFESVRVGKPVSPLDFHLRLTAVCEFMRLDAAESLAMANKRIANILKSASDEGDGEIDPALFDADEEQLLYSAVSTIANAHRDGLLNHDYKGVLEGLATLRDPVDNFFDAVMVMADEADKRRNRLSLLRQLRQLFLDVADLSCIPSH
jgi:glycyl-tRNA synthetase beta chain